MTNINTTPHPCMSSFLSRFKDNNDVFAFYNGDHILSFKTLAECVNCNFESMYPENPKFIPIEDYGYDHLVNSFNQMTDEEKDLLKEYFRQTVDEN